MVTQSCNADIIEALDLARVVCCSYNLNEDQSVTLTVSYPTCEHATKIHNRLKMIFWKDVVVRNTELNTNITNELFELIRRKYLKLFRKHMSSSL